MTKPANTPFAAHCTSDDKFDDIVPNSVNFGVDLYKVLGVGELSEPETRIYSNK